LLHCVHKLWSALLPPQQCRQVQQLRRAHGGRQRDAALLLPADVYYPCSCARHLRCVRLLLAHVGLLMTRSSSLAYCCGCVVPERQSHISHPFQVTRWGHFRSPSLLACTHAMFPPIDLCLRCLCMSRCLILVLAPVLAALSTDFMRCWLPQ
jgi:hypothetical protein